jgi:hypothetical protein
MKRNAFIVQSTGERDDLLPDFKRPYNPDTVLFMDAIERITKERGAIICASSFVTVDCLLTMRQIIESELTCRASIQLETIAI